MTDNQVSTVFIAAGMHLPREIISHGQVLCSFL